MIREVNGQNASRREALRTGTVADTEVPRRAALGAIAVTAVGGGAIGLGASGCANSGTSNVPATGSGPTGTIVALDDVPVGGVKSVTIDRKPAFVARPSAESVRAFSAICTHQGCTVVAAGQQLLCPCHGSHFELLTGAVTRGPAEQDLPAIPVHIDGDTVVAG